MAKPSVVLWRVGVDPRGKGRYRIRRRLQREVRVTRIMPFSPSISASAWAVISKELDHPDNPLFWTAQGTARSVAVVRMRISCCQASTVVSSRHFDSLTFRRRLCQMAEAIFFRLSELVARPEELARGRVFTAKVRAPPKFAVSCGAWYVLHRESENKVDCSLGRRASSLHAKETATAFRSFLFWSFSLRDYLVLFYFFVIRRVACGFIL